MITDYSNPPTILDGVILFPDWVGIADARTPPITPQVVLTGCGGSSFTTLLAGTPDAPEGDCTH